MDSRKQRKILLINMVLAACIISMSLFLIEATNAADTDYAGVGDGIPLMGDVYNKVVQNYVEPVDSWKLAKDAVNGMLDELDPYSSFFDPRDYQQMHEDSRGEFAGLGIEIATKEDYPTVMASPLDGSPAQRQGLRAGDVIIEIEGESTQGMIIGDVVSKLRGKEGTIVNFSVRRAKRDEPLKFSIKREKITLYNIPFAGEIEENIGYIKLSRFNAEGPGEMQDALSNLLKNPDLKGVILDLRYNPGGLLPVARDIANFFLPKGATIVTTRGRRASESTELPAVYSPILPDLPLVVLVNNGSASASEIVAGAIQDYDRGVLIGETTFGKGSVQTLMDLKSDTGLKLTTAHYYTPSGRCIHRKRDLEDETIAFSQDEEEIRGGNSTGIDSLKAGEKFYTVNLERVVYGGGGVTPDLIVRDHTFGNIISQLVMQSVFFDYAIDYVERHPELEQNFDVTDDMIEDFWAYILDREEFEYTIPGATHLERFRNAVEREKYDGDLVDMIDALEDSLNARERRDYDANRYTIERILKREISSTKFGMGARTIASKDWDVQLITAIEVLQDSDRYKTILSPGAETAVVAETSANEPSDN